MTSSITGRPSPVKDLKNKKIAHCGVKEAVFPFNMFQEVDPVLGPEMRSTGEVLGLSDNVGEAYYKAQEATQTVLPVSGNVLLSVCDRDKGDLLDVARSFNELGFKIYATGGTFDMINADNIPVTKVKKIYEGRPNISDMITNGELDLIINTPAGKTSVYDDSYIRKESIRHKVPYITTMAAAKASADGIKAVRNNNHIGVKALQDYHAEIGE